jgi:hypothetical protein
MYGGPVNPAAVAGLPGLAFGVSTMVGLLVSALTLVFAGVALARITPAHLRPGSRR